MPPLVALVGKPDCGKTTLLEKLIPVLAARGCRVGIIKHHHLPEVELDKPGKDTWRKKQAGAAGVILATPTGVGVIRDERTDANPLELAARYFADMDLVLCEGYKKLVLPKIEVFRSQAHETPLEPPGRHLIALVSDVPLTRDGDQGLPRFHPDDVSGVADFLVNDIIQPWQDDNHGPAAVLSADGRLVPLKNFLRNFLARSVKGMVQSLKGCNDAREITLTIHPDRDDTL